MIFTDQYNEVIADSCWSVHRYYLLLLEIRSSSSQSTPARLSWKSFDFASSIIVILMESIPILLENGSHGYSASDQLGKAQVIWISGIPTNKGAVTSACVSLFYFLRQIALVWF
jgi:hypothetical protein